MQLIFNFFWDSSYQIFDAKFCFEHDAELAHESHKNQHGLSHVKNF